MMLSSGKTVIKLTLPDLRPLKNNISLCYAYRLDESHPPFIKHIWHHDDNILDRNIKLYACQTPGYVAGEDGDDDGDGDVVWTCNEDLSEDEAVFGLPVAPALADGQQWKLLFQRINGKEEEHPEALEPLGPAHGLHYLVLQVEYNNVPQARKALGSMVVDNNTQFSNPGVVIKLSNRERIQVRMIGAAGGSSSSNINPFSAFGSVMKKGFTKYVTRSDSNSNPLGPKTF